VQRGAKGDSHLQRSANVGIRIRTSRGVGIGGGGGGGTAGHARVHEIVVRDAEEAIVQVCVGGVARHVHVRHAQGRGQEHCRPPAGHERQQPALHKRPQPPVAHIHVGCGERDERVKVVELLVEDHVGGGRGGPAVFHQPAPVRVHPRQSPHQHRVQRQLLAAKRLCEFTTMVPPPELAAPPRLELGQEDGTRHRQRVIRQNGQGGRAGPRRRRCGRWVVLLQVLDDCRVNC